MTVKYSELQAAIKETNEELKALSNELFEEDHWSGYAQIEVNTWGALDTTPMEAKVNWCAIGSVAPEKATAMAKLLTAASEKAQSFRYNGYTVTF